jgi:formate-nitrite transporter family protein
VSITIILSDWIGLGGFNHIIAGSTKQFYLVVTGVESWGAYFMQFFAPTLLENIIGGVSLVVFLGHAQVVAAAASAIRPPGPAGSRVCFAFECTSR